MICCSNCGQIYPASGVVYRCEVCGGVYDIPVLPQFDANKVDKSYPGIWRYCHSFGTWANEHVVSLGEGNTPLVWGDVSGREVAFKCEYLNPTGSFKDRGSSVLVSFLCSRGIADIVEDSSGNAGASLAAYAARAGISVKIFLPDSTSGPKRKQIEAYGAQVVSVSGGRENATKALLKVLGIGGTYASHAYLPFNLPGYATLAYELVEQLGRAPGTVVVPVGQGGLFLGLARGFDNLVVSGVITKIPKLVGVQALACAPLWALMAYGNVGLSLSGDTPTVAEGIRIRFPVRGNAVARVCQMSRAELLAVDENAILSGRDQLAKRGFFVEPTSAIVWDAFAQGRSKWEDPVVVILTGSGFKVLD